MSDHALVDTAEALRELIGRAVGDVNRVHVGPPIAAEVDQSLVSVFLFHTQVNAQLRNELRQASPPPLEPATAPAESRDALPLDLRFLITVFREPNGSARSPNELQRLGEIVQVLHAEPTLTGARLHGQTVRLTPEPYPMEELSRVWGLYPQDMYRTSVVYLASPVFIEARRWPEGPPVQRHEHRGGLSAEPPDLLGERELGSREL